MTGRDPQGRLTPAQDFKDGKAYYLYWFIEDEHDAKTEKIVPRWRPRIITSDRITLPIPLARENPRDVLMVGNYRISNLVTNRPEDPYWSYHSVKAFLDNTAEDVNPEHVWCDLLSSLLKSVRVPSMEIANVIVAWVIGTYFHQGFLAYPYLHITGLPGSGKSTLTNWLAKVTFNSESFVIPNAANIFRTIDETCCTLMMDEMENLFKEARNVDQATHTILAILKAGYSKSFSSVPRQEQENYQIRTRFSVYSPKVITSVNSLEDILATRTIPITMERSEHGAEFLVDYSEWQGVRDRLYHLMMTRFDDVIPKNQSKPYSRMEELIKPLRAMGVWAGRNEPILARGLDLIEETVRQQFIDTPETVLREVLTELVEQRRTIITIDDIMDTYASFFVDRPRWLDDQWLGYTMKKLGVRKTGRRITKRAERFDPRTGRYLDKKVQEYDISTFIKPKLIM